MDSVEVALKISAKFRKAFATSQDNGLLLSLSSQEKMGPGGGVLDQILDGDVPSRFQTHTRSLYQVFQNLYPTLYQFI